MALGWLIQQVVDMSTCDLVVIGLGAVSTNIVNPLCRGPIAHECTRLHCTRRSATSTSCISILRQSSRARDWQLYRICGMLTTGESFDVTHLKTREKEEKKKHLTGPGPPESTRGPSQKH